MSAHAEEISRRLKRALASAYAPDIDNPESRRICKGLLEGKPEGDLGLESVPINLVYSAMLEFGILTVDRALGRRPKRDEEAVPIAARKNICQVTGVTCVKGCSIRCAEEHEVRT